VTDARHAEATGCTADVGGAARYAGSRLRRVEDAGLLTGVGTLVADVWLPGMLHARFAPGPELASGGRCRER